LARWAQPPPPGCAPSWNSVKINPVLAKPRTDSFSDYFFLGAMRIHILVDFLFIYF